MVQVRLLQSASFNLGVKSVIKLFTGGVISGDPSDNDVSNATIFLGGIKKFSDAVGKISGPAIANSSTGSNNMGFSSYSMLPVLFINFTAIRNADNTIELKWTTAEEVNNKQYVVERSLNGLDWNELNIIAPGNDPLRNSYQYNDRQITSSTAYYRIKQVDMDGKFMYSVVNVIKGVAGKVNTSIYSANKNITVRFSHDMKDEVEVRVITMTGSVVMKKHLIIPVPALVFQPATFPTAFIWSRL